MKDDLHVVMIIALDEDGKPTGQPLEFLVLDYSSSPPKLLGIFSTWEDAQAFIEERIRSRLYP